MTRVETKHLTVDRNRAQLIVELPLHDVADLVGQLDLLGGLGGCVRRRDRSARTQS